MLENKNVTYVSTSSVLGQVMGVLSFLFLAMAVGTILVPANYGFGASILMLMLVLFMGIIADRVSTKTLLTFALVFGFCTGASLVPLLETYMEIQRGSIILTQAFIISFLVFAGAGIYELLTKRDLSMLGKYILIGLIALLIILVLSIFFSGFFEPFSMLIGFGGAILFTVATAYDFNRLKNKGQELSDKAVIMIAVSIFLDFVNLFLYILRILSSRR